MSAVRFEAPVTGGVGRIVFDRADDAVNAVNPELIEDLAVAVRSARAYDGLSGLVLVSAKEQQWIAGADLKMVAQREVGPAQLEAITRRFQAVVDELAWLPCTTVAAIDGAALGAGLEVALACDYRVASDSPRVSLGQPEVNLGLVPAGGGTQRLPRLVGLLRALDLILSGRRLTARRARRAGVIDEVVHPAVLEQAARAWASKPKRALDRPLRLGLSVAAAVDVAEQTPAGRRLFYRRARQAVLARTRGQYPAPLRALEAIEAGLEHGTAAGLQVEAQAFAELAATPTARNLIWLLLATQRQNRAAAGRAASGASGSESRGGQSGERAGGSSRGGETPRLGVVGAGFMGAAIAELGAAAGLSVRLRDVQPEAVARGLSGIRRLLDAGVSRRRFEPREARAILQRVSGTTDYAGFAGADVIIEAVFEDLNVKRNVIQELEAVVRPEAVIASNTSALPIRDIAAPSAHPERIVGMHFFSPAERMPLLEVIRPDQAAEWAVQQAVALGKRMGKTAIVVADRPGFYTSRVLGVMMNEATLLLGEGARLEQVDAAMTAFGFPVGPFVLYDEVGLQVALHVGETLAPALGDRLPAASVVGQLVAAGQTGRKAGAGFYIWRSPGHLPLPARFKPPARSANPAVYDLAGNRAAGQLSQQSIQDRLVLLFVNEALRCLDERVIQSPTDGDLGAVLGLGFPPFLGGPFHHADSLGLASLERQLRTLAAEHGQRYAPAGVLVERARAGRSFFEE